MNFQNTEVTSTYYYFTYSFCNIGRYENASCRKFVMLLSERSLKQCWTIKEQKRKQLIRNNNQCVNLLAANTHVATDFWFATCVCVCGGGNEGCLLCTQV